MLALVVDAQIASDSSRSAARTRSSTLRDGDTLRPLKLPTVAVAIAALPR